MFAVSNALIQNILEPATEFVVDDLTLVLVGIGNILIQ